MKSVILAVAATISLCSAAGVCADDDLPAAPFYVEADFGHVSVDRGSISLTSAQSGGINGTGSAVSLLGGYFFTDYIGVELAYHDYGSPTAFLQSGLNVTECPTSFSCPKITALTAELLGKIEVVPQLDGILRAGLQDWNVGSPGQNLLSKTSGQAFIYGVGVRRRFDNGLNFVATYERSSFTTEETRIGVSFSF